MVIESNINPSINPRKIWKNQYIFKYYSNFKGKIDDSQLVEEGKALCNLSNLTLGLQILKAKKDGEFNSNLIDAAVICIQKWVAENNMTHVCCIPTQKESSRLNRFVYDIHNFLSRNFRSIPSSSRRGPKRSTSDGRTFRI